MLRSILLLLSVTVFAFSQSHIPELNSGGGPEDRDITDRPEKGNDPRFEDSDHGTRIYERSGETGLAAAISSSSGGSLDLELRISDACDSDDSVEQIPPPPRMEWDKR